MTQIRLLKLRLLLSIFLLSVLPSAISAPLTLGIVPQYSPTETYRLWQPVVEKLEQQTGLDFELKLFDSIPEFETRFLKGEPDLAYMNPYHMVMAHKAAGYEPIIRDKEPLVGLLVVRKDSAITNLKQLDSSTLVFPAPNSFGASLYMRKLLSDDFGITFTPLYVTTHSNVLMTVVLNKAAAGGIINTSLSHATPEIREQIRVLYQTPAAYPHPIVIHPRVSAKIRRQVQHAFLALRQQEDTKKLLESILIPEPVATTYSEYKILENLNLERYIIPAP